MFSNKLPKLWSKNLTVPPICLVLNLNVSFPLLNSQHLHGGTAGGGASPCKQQSMFSQRDPFPWKTPPISLHSNGVISGLQTLPTQHAPF